MTWLLRRGLLLFALCCAACEGTETGNPDPSRPADDAGNPERDAGSRPEPDSGVASDAGGSLDAGGGERDAAVQEDAGPPQDAGPDEDAGDEDAG